ncbi:MAG: bifunctional serine/threonine-protein kinase/universal stress protein [Gammaproteobacteria bacterium]|nr:bifunctional serine/threonine-protein kinase/universal stress protein [Gammaproteobacteria bacterium]
MAAPRAGLRPPVFTPVRPGARIGRYKTGRLLHEGGMARLYAVQSKQPLILKVPKLGPDHPASSLVAFENELRIFERLHGPHVPRLVAAGDLQRQPCLLMERVDGRDLALAAARAPVDLDTLRDLGIRLSLAVHALHRQNVIHLDLNPGNVRNRADGTMVLIDFGLAHHAALPDLHDAAFGETEGTTAYIAPEQLHHVRSDLRSDVYAIGAILYQLATGQYPFGRPNLLSLRKRLEQTPLPPRALRPELPPWLQEIILRCLETQPEKRYATAKRIAHLLAHPESVPAGKRAWQTRPASRWQRLRAWADLFFYKFDEETVQHLSERLASSPHVLVVLDLMNCPEAQKEALRLAVRRLALSEPKSYFTCVSVVSAAAAAARARGKTAPDIESQLAMRNWAQPLKLPGARIVFQTLPGEPVRTLLGYAHRHLVDHIVIGAPGLPGPRGRSDSITTAVASKAECTVTVVRARKKAGKE